MTMRYNRRPDPALRAKVAAAFDREALARVCAMHESDFAEAYGLRRIEVDQPAPDDFFLFRAAPTDAGDSGSVLAVAHLDTVGLHEERTAHYCDTEGGLVLYSRALDDRLGAYIILELLPKLGIHHEIVLSVGEETGRSTAGYFAGAETDYHWMIEFDRGGTDVVMYQYEDDDLVSAVEGAGAVVGEGIFSDISSMDHLGVKGFNWGVGYRDYHGPRAHVWIDDMLDMVARYLAFHDTWVDTALPHEPMPYTGSLGFTWSGEYETGYCDVHMSDHEEGDDCEHWVSLDDLDALDLDSTTW